MKNITVIAAYRNAETKEVGVYNFGLDKILDLNNINIFGNFEVADLHKVLLEYVKIPNSTIEDVVMLSNHYNRDQSIINAEKKRIESWWTDKGYTIVPIKDLLPLKDVNVDIKSIEKCVNERNILFVLSEKRQKLEEHTALLEEHTALLEKKESKLKAEVDKYETRLNDLNAKMHIAEIDTQKAVEELKMQQSCLNGVIQRYKAGEKHIRTKNDELKRLESEIKEHEDEIKRLTENKSSIVKSNIINLQTQHANFTAENERLNRENSKLIKDIELNMNVLSQYHKLLDTIEKMSKDEIVDTIRSIRFGIMKK